MYSCIAVNGTQSQSYGGVTCHMGSLSTVLPSTRHKWTHPAWLVIIPRRVQNLARFPYYRLQQWSTHVPKYHIT